MNAVCINYHDWQSIMQIQILTLCFFILLENHNTKTSRLLLVLATDLESLYNLLSCIILLWKDLLISKTCSNLAYQTCGKTIAKDCFFLYLSVRQRHSMNNWSWLGRYNTLSDFNFFFFYFAWKSWFQNIKLVVSFSFLVIGDVANALSHKLGFFFGT